MLSTFVAVHAISLSLSLKVLTKQRLAFAALHNMPVDALVALAAGLGGGSSKQPAYDSHHLPAEAAAVTEVLARRNFVAVPGLSRWSCFAAPSSSVLSGTRTRMRVRRCQGHLHFLHAAFEVDASKATRKGDGSCQWRA